MKKEQVLAKLRSCGLVAVVRAKDADDAMRIAEACIEGGCAGIELTYTTPGVNAIIEKMAREYDGTDFVIGAGTVMDPETARMAILSGAQSVVSPYFNGDTVRLPWKDMAAALKQVNYQGAIVMEPFVLMGGTIPYDIKVWRDLSGGAGEAGLDEMAGRACRFLKELTA